LAATFECVSASALTGAMLDARIRRTALAASIGPRLSIKSIRELRPPKKPAPHTRWEEIQ
jgi:hypothetical protein